MSATGDAMVPAYMLMLAGVVGAATLFFMTEVARPQAGHATPAKCYAAESRSVSSGTNSKSCLVATRHRTGYAPPGLLSELAELASTHPGRLQLPCPRR
ncbi:hypothetical protein BST11_11485 [Mycobacterium alsense]|uniref:Uncharacterized protein n=1 Tax=Mycobacterium alsense TaxID=324058 RepID=A0AA42BZD8_9MYCO|nr:hypothetical protein [Mycobacterium alsense]MCV7379572.1 hypothetical protein [Mycobacterium alsense]OQZ90782.1 hypothetical protein BST11_11485 [Mycobacterium alsense]